MLTAMKRHALLVVGCALVATVALLIGMNYCAWEDLVQHHQHDGQAHEHHASGQHHRESQDAHHQFDPCCSMLQAIAAAPSDLVLAKTPPSILHTLLLLPVPGSLSIARSSVPTGLSPPACAPIPKALFYRTTFASHAPPSAVA